MVGKKQQTPAWAAFAVNIERARAFIRLFHGDGRGVGQPSEDEKQLLRGAVVFAVSSLDAYLHDLVSTVALNFPVAGDAIDEAAKEIGKKYPRLALDMALRPSDAVALFGEKFEEWISERSFQGPHGILHALRLVGEPVPAGGLGGLVPTDASAVADLARFTKMRHGLVHRAERPRITRDEASRAVDLVESFASAIDSQVLATRYR